MLADPKAVWSEAFLHYHAWLYYTKTVDLIAEASMNDQTREAARWRLFVITPRLSLGARNSGDEATGKPNRLGASLLTGRRRSV